MLDAPQFHYLNIDSKQLLYFPCNHTFFFFSSVSNDSLGYFTHPQPCALRKIVLEYCCSHVHTCYIVPVKGMGKL